MGLFRRDRGIEGERITHFHAGHASGCAVLAWDVRGEEQCEVLTSRSPEGLAEAPGGQDAVAAQTAPIVAPGASASRSTWTICASRKLDFFTV
jgi:hypothetical protein